MTQTQVQRAFIADRSKLMVDRFRVTSSLSTNDTEPVSANLERSDDHGSDSGVATNALINPGMTVSSGIFTFPSTGMYMVLTSWYVIASSDGSANIITQVTQNNSSYVDASYANSHSSGNSTNPSNYIVDVTDTSNVKVKFKTNSFASGTSIYGETATTYTGVWFIRLGDT